FAERIEPVVDLPAALLVLLDEMEFRLDTNLVGVAPVTPDAVEIAHQHGTWAVRPGRAVDVGIAGHPRNLFTPGEDCCGAEIGYGDPVRAVRPLTHFASGEACKASAAAGHVIEVRRRHQLGFGRTAELDKGAQKELYTLVGD